jgi:hypothetical protein
MKIYLFDTRNGLDEGDTYEEPAMLQYESGLTIISPPDYEHGQVPVFDRERLDWKLLPVDAVWQQLNSRSSETPEKRS